MSENDQPNSNQNDTAAGTSTDGGAATDPNMTPEQRMAALEAEKHDMRDRMLRVAAEFENWKKRARKEQAEAESKGKESILRDVLEVVDNLERAVGSWTETADLKAVQQGVQLVLRLFQQKLERHDIKSFEAKGQPFDPRVHDAISQVPSPDVAPGTVITELMKGYKIGDRLLRPASVVVAVAPPPAEGGSNGKGGAGATSQDGP